MNPLDEVRAVGAQHARAAARLASLERARNLSIVAALDAGESLSEVGRTLGLSHVRVLQIARAVRAEGVDRLVAEKVPGPLEASTVEGAPAVGGPSGPVGDDDPGPASSTEPDPSATAVRPAQCGRLGCPLPADAGRFCSGHQYN